MTKKLEELFGFDQLENNDQTEPTEEGKLTVEETRQKLHDIDETIDKIDHALPVVMGLDTGDNELDEIAKKAMEAFDDLMDLGMNVDSRFASELFQAASSMLGHAYSAKNSKLNKKLKMIDLQLRKLKMDRENNPATADNQPTETATGYVLSRNELLERLIGPRSQNDKKA